MEWGILVPIFFLFGMGLLMIYSVTGIIIFNNPAFNLGYTVTAEHYLRQQAFWGGISMVAMMVIVLAPHKWIREVGILAIPVTIGLLIATLLFGEDGNNSDVRRWLVIGGLRLQPGEFARLGLIYGVAWLVYTFTKMKTYQVRFSKKFLRFMLSEKVPNRKKRKYIWGSWLTVFSFIFLTFALIFIQPDLGSALIIFGMGMVMFLCSGISKRFIIFLMSVGIIGLTLAFIFAEHLLPEWQYMRFQVMRNPFLYLDEGGRQLYWGYRSIALGGLTGVGLGESFQRFGFAQEAHTDFIITILAEEWGVLMVFAIMMAYFMIAVRCFQSALKAKDLFTSMFSVGTGAFFLIQPIVNLGGVSGFIPISGVTLPLLSFGGTSAFAIFLMVGVYLNCQIEIVKDNLVEKVAKKKKVSNKVLKFQKAS